MKNSAIISLGEIKSGLLRLTPQHQRRWGKMTIEQMLHHLVLFSEITLGKRKVGFITRLAGKISGKLILKWILSKTHETFPKNLATFPELQVKNKTLKFEAERDKLIELLDELDQTTDTIVHSIYGSIQAESAKKLFSIHVSYHLKQFSCDLAK